MVYVARSPLQLPMGVALSWSHEIVPWRIQAIGVMLLFLGVCWLVARAGQVWAFVAGVVIVAESSLCALGCLIMAGKSNEAGPGWISLVIAVALGTWLIGRWVQGWRHRGDQILIH